MIKSKEYLFSNILDYAGTFPPEQLELKEEYEINSNEILNSIWASDKHSFPIQLSPLSMAKPSNSIVFFALVIFVHTAEKIFESPKNPATKTEAGFS